MPTSTSATRMRRKRLRQALGLEMVSVLVPTDQAETIAQQAADQLHSHRVAALNGELGEPLQRAWQAHDAVGRASRCASKRASPP